MMQKRKEVRDVSYATNDHVLLGNATCKASETKKL